MHHRTEWADAESNMIFLDYILEQTKGKEKLASRGDKGTFIPRQLLSEPSGRL